MHLIYLGQEVFHACRLEVEVEFLGLDLSVVEYVVDHADEVLGVSLEGEDQLLQVRGALEVRLGDGLG